MVALTDFYLSKKLIKKGSKFEASKELATNIKERKLAKDTRGMNRMIKTR